MSVFVSHASRDAGNPLYEVLLADLRKRSRRKVWVDSELSGGQRWWDEICRQIRDCSLFLVVVTPQLKKSDACAREVGYAIALSKPVLPVKITQVADWQLPELVAPMQVLDYTRRRDPGDAGVECAFNLSDAVGSLADDQSPLPDPLPEQPGVPDAYLSDLQRYLQAPELSLKDQEQFVFNVRIHLADEDRQPEELVGAIRSFLARPDVVHRVHTELGRCLTQLGAGVEIGAPSEVPETATEAAARETVGPHEPLEVPRARQQTGGDLSAIGEGSPPPGYGLPAPPRAGLRAARFPAPGVDVSRLADNLKGWFESQKLEAQLHADGSRFMVQCRSSSFTRKVGAGSALSVLLGSDGDELVIEIGGGKWSDKVAAAGVGALIAWPVLIPAAMGGYKQATLPRRTLSYIESMIPRCTH